MVTMKYGEPKPSKLVAMVRGVAMTQNWRVSGKGCVLMVIYTIAIANQRIKPLVAYAYLKGMTLNI
jgi:hypothetical protein